jgi:membrane protein
MQTPWHICADHGALWKIAVEAGTGFTANRLSTSAAAMAFYTMFALGPIMIFSIAIAEPFVGRLMAQQTIFDALSTIVEAKHLKGIQRFASEDLFKGGGLAAIVGACVLLYTGSRVFVELDDSFDVIWRGNTPKRIHPVLTTLQSRALALLLMVLLGVLLITVILTSVVLSAYAGALEKFPILGQWIGPAISGFTTTASHRLLHAIYKWLPTAGSQRACPGQRCGQCAAVRRRQPRWFISHFEVTLGAQCHGRFRAIMVRDLLTAHHPDRPRSAAPRATVRCRGASPDREAVTTSTIESEHRRETRSGGLWPSAKDVDQHLSPISMRLERGFSSPCGSSTTLSSSGLGFSCAVSDVEAGAGELALPSACAPWHSRRSPHRARC